MSLTRRDLLRTGALGGFAAATWSRFAAAQDPAAAIEPAVVRDAVARFRAYAETDDRALRLAVVYFHWFGVSDGKQIGQVPGPAIPADEYLQEPGDPYRIKPGMLSWNGSVTHHRRHDLALLRAGFDTIIFQIPLAYPRTQRNHFTALRQLKNEGVAIPKLVPFVEAASYPRYYKERDFHDPLIREALFKKFVGFFDRFFRELGPEDLVWKDGRVFVHLWWVPGIETAPASLLDELSERAQARYGFRLFVSAHEYLAYLHPDRVDRLFNGVQPWRRDRDGNYSLMPGFFPPSVDAVQRGYFLERRFGATYQGAWNAITDDVVTSGREPEWIVVESANEIGECTSILPLVELSHRTVTEIRTGDLCTARVCIPPGAQDYPVELGDDPMFYLNATADSWRRLRDHLGIA
jgi:hypothetical protein